LELALIEAVQGGPVAPVIVQQVVQQVVAPAAPGEPAPQAGQSAGSPPGAAPAARSTGRGGKSTPGDEPLAAPIQTEPPKLDLEAARRLQGRWKEFIALVKAQCGPNLPAALQAVRDIAVTDQVVALAFGNNEFSRNMVAKPEHLPTITAILSTFLGRTVALECQMGEKAMLSGRLLGAAEAPVNGPDPLVEFAVSALGAQVLPEGE
jgi:hypothetical protein